MRLGTAFITEKLYGVLAGVSDYLRIRESGIRRSIFAYYSFTSFSSIPWFRISLKLSASIICFSLAVFCSTVKASFIPIFVIRSLQTPNTQKLPLKFHSLWQKAASVFFLARQFLLLFQLAHHYYHQVPDHIIIVTVCNVPIPFASTSTRLKH